MAGRARDDDEDEKKSVVWFHVNRGGAGRNYFESIVVDPDETVEQVVVRALTKLANDLRQERQENEE